MLSCRCTLSAADSLLENLVCVCCTLMIKQVARRPLVVIVFSRLIPADSGVRLDQRALAAPAERAGVAAASRRPHRAPGRQPRHPVRSVEELRPLPSRPLLAQENQRH